MTAESELRERIWAFKELGYVYSWDGVQRPVWGCPRCGAVVSERFIHDDWHELTAPSAFGEPTPP